MLGMGGLGKMDPAKLEKLMKKMNIDTGIVDAMEVIIKKNDGKEIVFSEPQVMTVNMQGNLVYQVSGETSERETKEDKKDEAVLKEEDVKLIMDQTGKDKETVEKTLERLNNDLAKAIMELKNK